MKWFAIILINLICLSNLHAFGPPPPKGTMLLIQPPAISSATTNSIPFIDSFEQYSEGQSLVGTNGWTAEWQDVLSVYKTNNPYSGEFPLPSETHTNSLLITGDFGNHIQGNIPDVRLDLLIKPEIWKQDQHPVVETTPQTAFYINTNMQLYAYCSDRTGTNSWTDGWIKLEHPPISTNEYFRLTCNLSYQPDGSNNYFSVQVNTLNATNSIGETLPGNGTTNGAWFHCVSGTSNTFPGVSFTGNGMIDDFTVTPNICYVSTNSPTDGPGTAWSNAFHTIQAAVNAASSSKTVLVTNGVYDTGTTITPSYSCLNRVVITNNIIVRSVNGSDVTIIEGSEATSGGNGFNAVRCIYMSAGMLSGFTVTNGHTLSFLDTSFATELSGGGINMKEGNSIVSDCTFSGNSADWYGGGCYFGTLNNCTFLGNSAREGGGSAESTLNNCYLSDNSALTFGGGSFQGIINNCILSNNITSGSGGGSAYSTANNCTLLNNHASLFGGAALACILNNSLLSGNSADSDGGGCYSCNLYNCSVINNSSVGNGGGLDSCMAKNCIIYFNTAGSSNDNWHAASTADISNSCTTPSPGGTGNITNSPQFVDAAASNFNLRVSSPCIDTGNNADAVGNTDLDGLPRIQNGLIDMGAFEYQWPDSDGDKMPDRYEWLHSGNTTNMTDSADPDEDGQSNYQEYVAGMDATNANSFFQVGSVSNSQVNGFVISWESIPGRLYGIHWATNLTHGFTPLQTNIAYPQNSYTDTLHQAQESTFYKLDVKLK